MRIKHIAFSGIEQAAWERSQRIWLEQSIASGGLRSAWASERFGEARAVFAWESEAALRAFMEESHDRALEIAGSIGRHAVLYLDPLSLSHDPEVKPEVPAPPRGAAYVGETISWVKEQGVAIWMESQRVWSGALAEAEGCLGSSVARGRRTFVVTSFWRDEASHERYERVVVPGLRSRTRGDEQTARLLRFHGPMIPALTHGAV